MEWSAGAEFHLEMGKVVLVEIVTRHQALVLDRYQHGVGNLMLLCQLKVGSTVELGHQHNRTTEAERGQKGHQRGVGVQRRGNQRNAVRTVPEHQTALDM